MKRTAAILAGVSLAGGAAVAALQQESTQEEYGTESSIVTEDERQDRTGMSTDTQSEYETQRQSEYGTEPQTTDPYGDAETRTGNQPTEEPEMGTIPEAETTYGAEVGEDVSQMSSEELSGRPVMTMEGEEIGTIEQVGYSEMHQNKVATVNVGGFLGVGEKVIAIPLSELQMGSDEGLQTTMSREEIQSAEEFDPANLGTEQQHEQYEQQPYEQQPYEQQQ